jgi:hypothetical protein
LTASPDRGVPEGGATPTGMVKQAGLKEPIDPDAPPPGVPTKVSTAVGESATLRAERLELYKLAVEMADHVSERRTGANNFFLALHAAFASIVTFVGLQTKTTNNGESTPPSGDHSGMIVIVVIGVLLCAAWFLGLRSYRDLNTAKFKVINALETELPVRVFTDEWRYLKEDKVPGWRGRYREQGTVERLVPVLFGVIYVLAGLSALTR